MENYLIYDLESFNSDRAQEYWDRKKISPAANIKDPVKIEKNIEEKRLAGMEKSALSPITGRITCLGLSFNGDAKFFINEDEKALLEDINTFIEGKEIRHYVGWNNVEFDLPYLRIRNMANGLQVPDWLHYRTRHLDLMNMFGRRNMRSLKDMEFALDIRRDSNKDGAHALTLWKERDFESLERYCIDDVRSTEAIYLRMGGAGL